MTHLYYKESSSKQIKEVLDIFGASSHVDFNNLKILKDDYIYIVELNQIEKNILLSIKKLFSDKKHCLIYFFSEDTHSLMLFQLASLLNVKSVVGKKHNITKIILDIKKDISEYQKTQQQLNIARTVIDEQCFMVFKSKQLIFASQKIYNDFKCKTLDDVDLKICTKLDLDILNQDDTFMQSHFLFDVEEKLYNIKSITSKYNDEKYIYIENTLEVKEDSLSSIDFIKNRIHLIEILKEKVLEKSISESLFGLITMQVENMSNLKKDWSEYEIEMAIADLFLNIAIELGQYTLFAQYDSQLYTTLFEELNFESIKSKATNLNNYILKYTSKQKIKPLISLYAFDINDLELNEILKIISDISKKEVSFQDVKTKKLYKISNIDEGTNDFQVIDILLETIFTNNTPLKLLNIYKGLCINTSAIIIKRTDEEIYVKFEQLQGTAMHFEKQTILQSSSFSKDIQADVVYTDNTKKIAQLKNFSFVKGSANARKYSRVTCSQRTPVTITYDSGNLSGEILDISMNSIAIKSRLNNAVNSLKISDILISFTLPYSKTEEGYIQLELKSKVVFSICDDKFCKIIVNLYENQDSESVLMEYVYNRQKEIIVELKKQTSMLK